MFSLTQQTKKQITLLLAIAILWSVTFQIQVHIASENSTQSQIEDLKYLPNGNFLKGAALSYKGILADLLWIKALVYFGEHVKSDQQYTWLYHILDITTTLDPYFEDPYEFAGIVLAEELGDIDGSIKLLKRGMDNVPKSHDRYWYLPFFLSYNYMYYKKDFATAAHFLEIAAKYPQSPSYIPLLVSRLYANSDNHQVAVSFLTEMINSTQNKQIKESLVHRIQEIIVDQHIRQLEKYRDQFYQKWDRYPVTLKELQEKQIIETIPEEPFGGYYTISPSDHSISSSTMSEKLVVHIDKKSTPPQITIQPIIK